MNSGKLLSLCRPIWASILGLVITVLLFSVFNCKREPSDSASTQKTSPEPSKSTKPNIILITLCTFRYSHMSIAGYPRQTTPFLDSLAKNGVLFENGMSTSSWTKPSSASILTGLTPNVHMMTDFYFSKSSKESDDSRKKRMLHDGFTTIAEVLSKVGYDTYAQVNNVHVTNAFNMLQGFSSANESTKIDTSKMLENFSNWVSRVDDEKPFFFFLLSRDAHVTFNPKYENYVRFNRFSPPVPKEQYKKYYTDIRAQVLKEIAKNNVDPDKELKDRYVDLYDAELAQLDEALSRIPSILERVGRLSNTIIIVTADHGERFFDHGLVGHGGRLDMATVKVPIIISGLGMEDGGHLVNPVSTIDLYSTIMEFAGAPISGEIQSQSLLPIKKGTSDPDFSNSCFASLSECESRGWLDEYMVRSGNYVYYRRGSDVEELYDLEKDAGELNDILKLQPKITNRLREYLRKWLEQEQALRKKYTPGGMDEMSLETTKQLRELGYIE